MVWVLDVEGRPLVVDASYWPGATPDQRQQLESVVESIRFA
jgi:hypothetical protein